MHKVGNVWKVKSININIEEEFNKREEKSPLWRKHGNNFGYPQCCIDFFCAVPYCGSLTQSVDHWAYGTGYVPCPQCSKLPREQLIDIINKNRKIDSDFPNEGDY